MANITSVHVTAGIPDGGTGTVSTIDNLIIVGMPVSGTVTAVVSGTTFISGGTLTAVVSGTTFISGGTVTSVVSGTAAINQGGAALSSTNGIYANVLFNNALVSASVGLPVNLVTYIALTAVVSGTTFISGGNVTAVVSGTTVVSGTVTAVVSGTTFISGGNATAALNQGGAALSATNGIFANVLLGNAVISSTNPVMVHGETANGVADANNPIKIGGVAKSAQPTGVADGNRVNALFDLLGKQVVVQSVRGLKAAFYTTISTTSETVLIPAISTAFVDVYGAIIANKSGSTILMTFKDSSGGNTQFELEVPSFDTRGFMMPESAAFKQTAQNTTWTVTPSLATSISLSLLYVKNTTS